MANRRKNVDPASTNHHHLYEPASNYTTPLEKEFRSHPANIVEVNEDAHVLWNHHRQYPKKPTEKEMREFLDTHPLKEYRKKKRHPAEFTTRSITAAKGAVLIVYRGQGGDKEVVKVSCTECKDHRCFQPIVEFLGALSKPSKKKKKR